MAVQSLEFDKFKISYIEELYFDVIVFPNVDMFAPDVAEMVAACNKLSGNTPRAAIVTVGEFANFNPDAREFTADPTKETATIAFAYVLSNLAQRMVANFFIRFNRPTKPVRFFSNRESAMEWLEQYIHPS